MSKDSLRAAFTQLADALWEAFATAPESAPVITVEAEAEPVITVEAERIAEAEAAEEEITTEEIRKAASDFLKLDRDANRPKLQKLLEGFGAERATLLKPEQRREFLAVLENA